MKHEQKTFGSPSKNNARKDKKQQEIGDNLSVCVINLLSVVSTLPRLVAISL